MPKPGYANLTIRKEAADRLAEYAAKNKISAVTLLNMLSSSIPMNVDVMTLVNALKNIELMKVQRDLTSSVVKLRLSTLFYHIDALVGALQSLIPSYAVDLKIIQVLKIWQNRVHPCEALRTIGILEYEDIFDVIQLLSELKSVRAEIEKILDKNFQGWRQEVAPPVRLPGEPHIPDELLKPEVFADKRAHETLRNMLQHWLASIEFAVLRAEEIVVELSRYYPEVDALCSPVLKQVKRLFKVT